MPDALPAKNPMRWMWIAIVIAAVAGAALYWRTTANKPAAVAVEVASLGPVTRVLAVNGQIAARRSVALRSAVSATVLTVVVDEGDAVAAGDPLATLDASQAKAAERQAQSALEQGMVKQAQAATDFGRMRDLGKNVARSMLEDADLALQGAAQDVARLQALLDQARIALDHYTLRAPITGTVMQRGIEPGQLLDPAISAFTVADLNDLIVQTDVDEAYATQIAPHQEATLQLVGTTDLLPGSVQFVSTSVDATTGGLSVKIGFDAAVKAPVGLTVTANIVVDQREAISVPRTALTDGAVFVLLDGKARSVPIGVIEWPATRLIVTKGLTEGDVVIVDATGIMDGQAVKQAAP
jgi:HlyD family secretion protein